MLLRPARAAAVLAGSRGSWRTGDGGTGRQEEAGLGWALLGWAGQLREPHGGTETPLHPDPPLAGQREVPQPADCPLSPWCHLSDTSPLWVPSSVVDTL